jgi:hypothetical protein
LLPFNTKLNFSDRADNKELRDCLNGRLGVKAVDLTALNSNTQKSESVNRTYQKTNPKTNTFGRNFPGRIHSAAHLRNNGMALSTVTKMRAAGLHPAVSVHQALGKEEKGIKYRAAYNQSAKHKLAAYRRRKHLYRMYDNSKNKYSVDYKSNMAMPKLNNNNKS